ncbi:MAG: DnaJ domain-containing protein [Nanoarchaeota archaeon]|nr:DnaJ domain-containing protein [Nanoarchaeota archaeon]
MNPSKITDLYARLEIEKNADLNCVKTAYRKQAIRWHPDKNPDDVLLAQREFIAVSEAYEILSNVNKRASYDRTNHFSGLDFNKARSDDLEEKIRKRYEFYESIFKDFENTEFGHYFKGFCNNALFYTSFFDLDIFNSEDLDDVIDKE